MKTKVINLFSKPQIVQNKGVKYSTLLEQFIEPFINEFDDAEYYDDMFDFTINAWNFGNMKSILPEGGSEGAFKGIDDKDLNIDLLKRMMDYKISHFKEYTNFIVDYEIKETGGDPIVSVITQEQDGYLASMVENIGIENTEDDFEKNYINRTAIIIKPLQPFVDWCSNLYPDELALIKETRTYLISEEIEELEPWLKKKYDKIFSFELESWNENKKDWPQKRSYKMFKEWFQADISTMIYDFEMKPVTKIQ